jgi:hypothetical protein
MASNSAPVLRAVSGGAPAVGVRRPASIAHLQIRLSDEWIARSFAFAKQTVEGYVNGDKPASLAMACTDIAFNLEEQAYGRMSECAFAVFCGLNPGRALDWGPKADSGFDLVWRGHRWDVKSTHAGGKFLLWPVTKNHVYDEKAFDRLVLVKHKAPNFLIRGWISKADFRDRKRVAGQGHKLFPGTWFVDQTELTIFERDGRSQ